MSASFRKVRALRRAAACTVALLGFASHASAQQGLGCDDLRGQPINFGVDWQSDVKPIFNELLGGRCTSCHNSGAMSGGLNLSDDPVDAIYTIVGFVVFPSDVRNSILFDKVNCEVPGFGGLRMPQDGSPLTIEQQALIYDWIEQGAQGEPKDPIFREVLFRDGGESLRWY